MDVLGRQLGLGQSLDLGDDDAAVVVGGVGLIERAESAALLFVGEVAVRVGGRGADDRDVDVDRRVEQVVVAVDLHQLDEVVGDGVHLGAFQPRVGVRAQPDLGQHARLPGGGGPVHLEQHSGGDVERLNLIIVDQLPDQRRVQLRAAGRVGAGQHPAQLPRAAQVVDALDAVHVAGGNRVQGGQVCRGAGLGVPLPDCLQHSIGTAKPGRGGDGDDGGVGDQRAASAPVSTGTVRISAGSFGSDEQLGTGTAAGLPRLELDWELLAYGRLGRSRRALEYELGGATARLASRHRDAAQRGSVETGVVDVVEADHPDVRSDTATRCRRSHPGRRRRPRR